MSDGVTSLPSNFINFTETTAGGNFSVYTNDISLAGIYNITVIGTV
jgi:hypothetical protein